MTETNQDTIGEQCIKKDKYVLEVIGKDNKIV